MEKSGKGSVLVCLTVIISVGIVTYGITSFGRSIERSCDSIKDGMVYLRPTSIPSSINLKFSSNSIETASRNIADGMKNSPTIKIPPVLNLNLAGNGGSELKVNLNRTGNP